MSFRAQCVRQILVIPPPPRGTERPEQPDRNTHIVVYEVMAKSLRRREWRIRRKELERLFRQDEVVIRVLQVDQV